MGWVSLFEPEDLRMLLRMPAGARPVAVLCLGHVPEFYPRPMLEMTQWTEGCGLGGRGAHRLLGQSMPGYGLTPHDFSGNLSARDKFPSRGFKGNSGSSPGCPRNCRRCAPHP